MRAIPLQGIWCSDNLLNEEKRDDESPYLQRRLAKGDRQGMLRSFPSLPFLLVVSVIPASPIC